MSPTCLLKCMQLVKHCILKKKKKFISHGSGGWEVQDQGAIIITESLIVRESFPRQVDRESRGPQRERGLEFQGGRKDKLFFLSLYSLGFYNNNVSCLRTVSGLNLLANSVILKCKLWEVLTTSRHSLDYITSLLTLASGYSFCPLLMPMSEAFSISFIL